MNQAIQEFMQGKRIAVVGVSRNPKKFGTTIATELKARGYQVFYVHPEAKEIGGEPCYPNLAALEGKVDGAVICVSPKQSARAIEDAAKAGIKKIWLQQGAESTEALAKARELGIDPISRKCILMYAHPVRSFHAWHRAFNKLIGQL